MRRKIFALVRTLVVSALFLALWLWLLPRLVVGPNAYDGLRPAGLVPFILGLALGLWCAFEFAWRGLGTPAPFDPPRQLVITGPYRFVRNPMYVGMGIAILGEAYAFPQLSRFMLVIFVVLFMATNIFIAVYEEPALRRMFGSEYEHYCANVRRWIPRLTPFDMQRTPAVH